MNINNQKNAKLKAHYSYICEFSNRMNIMSRAEIEKGYEFFYQNHVLDALKAVDLNISWTNMKVVDVGSGSGIPGIPIAIVLGDIVDSVTLIESTSKKASFLKHVIESIGLTNVKVVNERAENVGNSAEFRDCFDIALTRAVGYIDECMEITLPMLKIQGVSLLYRGQLTEKDIQLSTQVVNNLGGKLEQIVDYCMPGLDKSRNIMVIRKESHTSIKYPRAPGKPKKLSIFKDFSK